MPWACKTSQHTNLGFNLMQDHQRPGIQPVPFNMKVWCGVVISWTSEKHCSMPPTYMKWVQSCSKTDSLECSKLGVAVWTWLQHCLSVDGSISGSPYHKRQFTFGMSTPLSRKAYILLILNSTDCKLIMELDWRTTLFCCKIVARL